MKIHLTILFSLCLSQAIYAMDINTSSWQEIRSNELYQVEKKQISFQGSRLNIFSVCTMDESSLRSQKPISTYEWDKARSDDLGPVSTQPNYLTTSRHYIKTYSDGDTTHTTQESHPLSYELKVSNLFSGQQYSKTYKLPAC